MNMYNIPNKINSYISLQMYHCAWDIGIQIDMYSYSLQQIDVQGCDIFLNSMADAHTIEFKIGITKI